MQLTQDFDLTNTIDKCRSSELVKKTMSEQTTTENCDAICSQPNKQRIFHQHNNGKPENQNDQQAQWSQPERGDACTKRGHVHRIPIKCPARWMICRYCHKEGHHARCCFKKKHIEEQDEMYEEEQEDIYYLEEVRIAGISPWLVSLSVLNIEISFKVDSGADVTVIQAYIYESMQQRPMLQPT